MIRRFKEKLFAYNMNILLDRIMDGEVLSDQQRAMFWRMVEVHERQEAHARTRN